MAKWIIDVRLVIFRFWTKKNEIFFLAPENNDSMVKFRIFFFQILFVAFHFIFNLIFHFFVDLFYWSSSSSSSSSTIKQTQQNKRNFFFAIDFQDDYLKPMNRSTLPVSGGEGRGDGNSFIWNFKPLYVPLRIDNNEWWCEFFIIIIPFHFITLMIMIFFSKPRCIIVTKYQLEKKDHRPSLIIIIMQPKTTTTTTGFHGLNGFFFLSMRLLFQF